MAQELDDGEFWLPPQFLTEDELLMDFKNISKSTKKTEGDKCFGRENDIGAYFPYDFPTGLGSFWTNSELSSPVESVVGSTETESDEDEYLTGLTRKLDQSTLEDDLWKAEPFMAYEKSKSWALSGSPQSTLCSALGGCGCKQDSSRGSPNCPSQVSSPPAMGRNEAAWDLLHAAAGEVAKMRMVEEGNGFYQNRGIFVPPRKPSPILKNPNPSGLDHSNLGFHSNQSIYYQQLQAAQFMQLKRQQMMKQQGGMGIWGQQPKYQQKQSPQIVQNRERNGGGRTLGLSMSAWPTLQQSQQQNTQPGSGMRAVFLGNPGAKRECAGTGVFLPRRAGIPTETRKKPVCSTVLLPDRVVQALNLNLDSMDAQVQLQPPHGGTSTLDYDASSKYRNNLLLAQQRRNGRPLPVKNQEVRLPQEWTY
ncbi:unnamed protein product [Ilex paraguariensis]|uniref:TIP41-like protein n=1 Tax=Ilex paraguariensis TaxID=185542 RepID=A0ABC8SAE2_9AQUA